MVLMQLRHSFEQVGDGLNVLCTRLGGDVDGNVCFGEPPHQHSPVQVGDRVGWQDGPDDPREGRCLVGLGGSKHRH
jgi:hypothetical protein